MRHTSNLYSVASFWTCSLSFTAAYGWFPDCGMTWFLPRLKYEVNGKQFTGAGMWLALTGAQIDAWSMKYVTCSLSFVLIQKFHVI